MRIVLQRVSSASVTIDGEVAGSIGAGMLLLLGVTHEDEKSDADWLVKKVCGMRIFGDDENRMNLNASQVEDSAFLVISQFTLFASCKKGNRPSFIGAARPEKAIPLYEYFKAELAAVSGLPVACGEFGADMKVALVNDGPVTILLDSKNRE